MAEEMTVHCPKCDSQDIREKNEAIADLPVMGWEIEDGELRPTDYDYVSADWEAMDVANQYVCRGCGWEGRVDQLKVKNDPTTPVSQATSEK